MVQFWHEGCRPLVVASHGHKNCKRPLRGLAVIPMQCPTPAISASLALSPGPFNTLVDGLEYAAKGETGFNYFSVRGELLASLPYATLRERAISVAGKALVAGPASRRSRDFVDRYVGRFSHTFFCLPVRQPNPRSDAPTDEPRRARGIRPPCARDDFIRRNHRWQWHLRNSKMFFLKPCRVPSRCSQEHQQQSTPYLNLTSCGRLAAEIHAISSTPPEVRALPKELLCRKEAVTKNAHAIISHGLQVTEGDRCTSWLPLFHDMGLVGFCIAPLLAQLSTDYITAE